MRNRAVNSVSSARPGPAPNAAVAHRVHRLNRVSVGDEPSGEGVVESEVLGVAVQKDDETARVAVGQPGVMEEAALAAVEAGHCLSSFRRGGRSGGRGRRGEEVMDGHCSGQDTEETPGEPHGLDQLSR
jgi:hypothetical protein